MFVTGPDVVKTVTNEIVTAEELGGASTHTKKSSVADGAFENDLEALAEIRRLMDFLPLNNREKAPVRPFFDDPNRIELSLDTLIPENPNTPYDMKELIVKVADESDFYEIQRLCKKYNSWFYSSRGSDNWRCCEPTHGTSWLFRYR